MTFLADTIGYFLILVYGGEFWAYFGKYSTVYIVKRMFPKWAGAQTFGKIILVRDAAPSIQMLRHEACHTEQYRRYDLFGVGFFFVYLWQWISRGFKYGRIPLEVEAREAEERN
jgi:hypothetical protein